jgi:hypothetical protein
MNLAAILTIYLLSMGSPGPGRSAPEVRGAAIQQPSKATTDPSTPQATQAPQPQPAPATTGSPSTTAAPAKPAAQPTRRRKKKTAPCSTSPAALNTTPGNATGTAGSGTTSKPCPPPKKVVRNGGSEEPSIQLVGGTSDDHASQQRSTEQLTTATDENLKKIAGRQLTPAQQDMVNQVKQFMDQSKTAVAAGNPERGHNLAQKANLLSQELLKP